MHFERNKLKNNYYFIWYHLATFIMSIIVLFITLLTLCLNFEKKSKINEIYNFNSAVERKKKKGEDYYSLSWK